MEKSLKPASKFLSYVLRHNPRAGGVTLDDEGWAPVAALIANSQGRLSRAMLDEIVATNEKRRFALSGDGQFIRANQGHSVPVDLKLQAVAPPALLYHGTALRHLDSILATGLAPRGRQHVHLSGDPVTARRVGQRHGKPVVLQLPAREMHAGGHRFYRAENGVWLTDAVPPEHLHRAP